MTRMTDRIETSRAMLRAVREALTDIGPITYGRIARDTARISQGKVPHALGVGGRLDKINAALHAAGVRIGLAVPPISAVVVNKATGRPGGGLGPQIARWAPQSGTGVYDIGALMRCEVSERAWRDTCAAVRGFPHWDRVMDAITDEDWAAVHRSRGARRTADAPVPLAMAA